VSYQTHPDIDNGFPTRGVPQPIEILLIEDNPGDIVLIRRALARESFPISIRVAVDGQQAIEMLSAGLFEPDLVILDLNVPKVSGLSLFERCKFAAPVVVFSSAFNSDETRRAFKLGAKDVVRKPTDLDEYNRQLSAILRNWAKPTADRIAR